MLGKYKKSYLVINVILSLLLVFLCVNLLYFKQTSYLFLIISILIPTLILIFAFGYEKKRRRFMYELIFYIFAYSVVYLLVTYVLGTFIGFNRNVYKLNIPNLIHNIIPYAILILVSEVLRYQISRKGDGSLLAYILVTIVLIAVDLTLFLDTYNLTTGDGQIKYICAIFLPSIFKNIALLYFTKNGGMYPSLVYRLILDLKLVILPIFPAFGLHFECIINTILPMVICFLSYLNLKRLIIKQQENVDIKKTVFYRYLLYFILLSVVIIINILTSCSFKYNMLAIGSGSMTPKINKGDAVVYERLNEKKLPKEGEIIVFKKESKTVVHRVIEIVHISDSEYVYYTKGDANEKPDGYPIEIKDILGTVKYRIRYIGIPSVVLGELIG